MSLTTFIFGRFSWDVLPTSLVQVGGGVFMVVMTILVAGLITYLGKWRWLWKEYLTSLDAKKIGVMYIALSLIMLIRGGSDALLMRIQQVTSVGDAQGILTPEHFQQIFSAHGSIMIFFVAMGVMFGLINLVLPLQIGTRDVAFPFLNSLSFWLFAFGAVLVNISLVLGDFSTAGWLSYPPLSELQYSPTVGVDYWIWSIQISGLGSLLSGVNFIATILMKRAKGMNLMKMPMFVWTVFGSMILVTVTFPILTATLALLALDRTMGMHFFTIDGGGNMMMYVNLIWAWGHPEVYILVLPAFGIFSEIVPVFSGKKLAGYTSMVFSIVAITFFSFVVWLHHFFTMGAGGNVNAVFGIATMVIAIPTGVKMFNWLFTMYRGRIRFETPMLWFMGFVVLFTLGGMTGVMLAEPAADFQLHNSLFLVAHFHTMIISGVLFGYFAGMVYWWPKVFGFKLHEGLGIGAFWCWLVGFILAFGPLYLLGFMGATRRLDHYDASLGWQPLFFVAAIGAVIILIGFLLQVVQILYSFKNRAMLAVGSDPWDGRTLEWSVASPPAEYNYKALPVVSERDAFWHNKQKTILLAYEPMVDFEMPRNSAAGLYIAASAFLVSFGLVWHLWWLVGLGLVCGVAFVLHRTFDEEVEEVMSVATL